MGRSKKRKKYLWLFLAAFILAAAGLFYYVKSWNLIEEAGFLESRINEILFQSGLDEEKVLTTRSIKTKGFKKWIEIRKEITATDKVKNELLEKFKNLDGFKSSENTFAHKGINLIFLEFTREKPEKVLAIVIDDVGRSKKEVERFLELNIPLTFAVLPYQKHSSSLAETLWRSGYTVLLHQPMEPHKKDLYSMGKGALLKGMSKKEIEKILASNLENVKFVHGVNNHMGSLFTEQKREMEETLSFLKKKNLFFLDSATSSQSVALEAAKKTGTLCLRNDIFLDNEDNLAYIKNQISKAIKIAQKKGKAIAIGHATRKHIVRALEGTDFRGVKLVKLTEILEKNADSGN